MMAARQPVPPEYGFARAAPRDFADTKRSSFYGDVNRGGFDKPFYTSSSAYSSNMVTTAGYNLPATVAQPIARAEHTFAADAFAAPGPAATAYGGATSGYGSYTSQSSQVWEPNGRVSPEDYADADFPSPLDYALDGSSRGSSKTKKKGHSQRRPSNRDEFDGPHQFLKRPPPEYIAEQERDLPHLPTNLVVQEQDEILNRVNDRLSQCAFDFVAKYQFPIPLTADMRPVERPEDREWTEWVYLLKRLATKRRIPARVLYNGQIKQFVTILENSLEMRHAAKHQSRPLKDDRNILQLISAGIQVAKILKDASAMDYLDRLYTDTARLIQDRSNNITRFH